MYDVGVIGCGVVGNRLAESFDDHERTTVWGACDVDESKVSAFAEKYDCEAFTDHRDLIARDEVDVVYVGVPPVHHAAIVRDALESDKHVICEKPLAENPEEGQRMVELAAESEQATAVNLPFRYTPGFVAMRERIEAGEIGQLKRITLDFRFPGGPASGRTLTGSGPASRAAHSERSARTSSSACRRYLAPSSASVRRSATAPPTGTRSPSSVTSRWTTLAGRRPAEVATRSTEPSTCSRTTSSRRRTPSRSSVAGLALLLEWHRLVENRGGDDETVLNDARERTTLTLVDEFVAELDGERGDLVSFAEANRVQRVVDAIFASDGTMRQIHDSA
jgi:predicted dehydrogenase